MRRINPVSAAPGPSSIKRVNPCANNQRILASQRTGATTCCASSARISSGTVTGAAVKGPVAGAQVCAYTVVANGRGAALGACTTSDAAGHYSFAVPAGAGPLWVKASGGSYTDEATGAATTLPSGSPLRSIITANNGTVNSMLTPLTTLALNAAAAASSGATLDAGAFSTAAAQLLLAFNLPSTLNIGTTLPTFGANINSCGNALTAISQMVANGATLASILSTPQASTLAAAYAIAVAGPVVTPPVTPPASSASGSWAVAGTTATGAATTLAPQTDGFEVSIKNGTTTYRFFNVSSAPAKRVEVSVSVSAQGAQNVSHYDLAARNTFNTCAGSCGVSITSAAGATHPVTLVFANTALSGGLTLNGSLVGDATGAAWSLADLHGGTSSSLTLNGNAVRAVTASDTVIDAGNGNRLRSIVVQLSDGSTLQLNQTGTAPYSVGRVLPPATISSCATACSVTVTDAAGTRLSFVNTPMSSGLVVNGTVDYARTSGSLTSSDLGGFTPTASTIE